MDNMTIDKEMVIYKHGSAHIQDVLRVGADGVARTACRGLTFEEYVQAEGAGFLCVPFDEAIEQIRAIEDAQHIKPFKEITEEQYYEMLECLPPQKWLDVEGGSVFRMSEYQTSNITGHYVALDGRFFAANRRTTVDYADIVAECRKLIA